MLCRCFCTVRGLTVSSAAIPVLLELLARGGKAARKAPATSGAATYAVEPGKTATVKVKLNKRGRGLLRKRKSAKVALSITPGGAEATTTPLKLKR